MLLITVHVIDTIMQYLCALVHADNITIDTVKSFKHFS